MARPPLSLSARLRRELRVAIDAGHISIAGAADHCDVSTMTLQRFLAEPEDEDKPSSLKLGTAEKLAERLGWYLVKKGSK